MDVPSSILQYKSSIIIVMEGKSTSIWLLRLMLVIQLLLFTFTSGSTSELFFWNATRKHSTSKHWITKHETKMTFWRSHSCRWFLRKKINIICLIRVCIDDVIFITCKITSFLGMVNHSSGHSIRQWNLHRHRWNRRRFRGYSPLHSEVWRERILGIHHSIRHYSFSECKWWMEEMDLKRAEIMEIVKINRRVR